MSNTTRISFEALEYTEDDSFSTALYEFIGDVDTGWTIRRNQRDHLSLGPGYELLRTELCGICSTDINRRFLPFPLPQITGHEVVATRPNDPSEQFVVEINDTSYYRGDSAMDAFCDAGLPTHSPARKTLGIDRLPGGFGRYVLAPRHSIIPIGELTPEVAVLMEPFAAALHAVLVSPPQNGDRVAVLGPRKLGSLLVAALAMFRRSSGINFEISAVARRPQLLEVCAKLGADHGVDLFSSDASAQQKTFDVVFDTTGTASGFELALALAKREVHLKSTNGQTTCGLNALTDFVIDELSLLAYTKSNLDFHWSEEHRTTQSIYLSPGTTTRNLEGYEYFHGSVTDAMQALENTKLGGSLKRFDTAVASSLEEIDHIIRCQQSSQESILRPRGAILFAGDAAGNPLLNFICIGGRLRSSRCGNFNIAQDYLQRNPDIADSLGHCIISDVLPAKNLAEAFQLAQQGDALKVVIRHDH